MIFVWNGENEPTIRTKLPVWAKNKMFNIKCADVFADNEIYYIIY